MHTFLPGGRASAFCFLLVALLLGLGQPAWATHIVGGEMQLEHQRGADYQLTLNVYFDAVNGDLGALDPSMTASIFEKGSNRRLSDLTLPLTSNTLVNYTSPACASSSLVTRLLVYRQAVSLPASIYTNPQGYYVAVERCCRNNSISNIDLPGEAAQTFYLEFPAVVRDGVPFVNSTPRTFPALADYACVNELFYYDFGGQDSDGDSLAYDLVTPLNGHASPGQPKPSRALSAPYQPITWNPGLSARNQIPGSPTLRIDARTGRLTVRPTDGGLYVFGVRCTEYRRGVRIGEVRRDFQLQVRTDCRPNTAPVVLAGPAVPGGPPAYRAGRDTLRLRPNASRCLSLRFTDADRASDLRLRLVPVNFSGPLPAFTTVPSGRVRGPGMPDTLQTTLCFPTCLDTGGKVYLLDVIVSDNGCSLPGQDTLRVAFTAEPAFNSPPTIVTTAPGAQPLRVRVGDLVSFDVTGTDAEGDAVTLELGGRGFSPTALGAMLGAPSTTGGSRTSRFTWRVECPAVTAAPYEFQFTAVSGPCGLRQTATVTVPIVVDYANQPPALQSDLPGQGADPTVLPEIKLPLGAVYTANFQGFDADGDNLTLTATGQGFDLAAAGMRFEAQTGAGTASGTFRWEADCRAANLHRDLVVLFRLEDATCRPLPQLRAVRFTVRSPDTLKTELYNVITPNADGLNDAFELPSLPPDFCDARFATLQIFTRWGTKVYETTARDFRWPGQGSAGLYFYLVKYTDGRRYKGWLEVLP